MQRPRNNLPVLAFAASLLIHAMLLVALPMAIEAAAAKTHEDREDERFPDSLAMHLPEEQSVEVELGIDAPTPPTETWIGHEETQPQLAEQFDLEQAAFVDEPVAAAPPPQAEVTPQEQATEMVEAQSQPPADPSSSSVEVPVQEQAAASHAEELEGATPLGLMEEENLEPKIEPIEAADLEQIAEAVRELLQEVQRAISQIMPAAPPMPDSSEPQPQQPQQSESSPQEPAPQVAPQAQEAPREFGTPADMESSPTSIIDIPPDQWQLGKPLARQGLQLKPRRPDFTLLTMLTAAPGNPLCQIKFGPDGVPRDASLLRSSGDKRVDDGILASLYRWRAEGVQLQQVAEGKTLDVQVRIILNRRAAAMEETRNQAKPSGPPGN